MPLDNDQPGQQAPRPQSGMQVGPRSPMGGGMGAPGWGMQPSWQPPATWADAFTQGFKYLAQQRLAEVALFAVILGLVLWVEPNRRRDEDARMQQQEQSHRMERKEALDATNKTLEKVTTDNKEALNGAVLQMQQMNRETMQEFRMERQGRFGRVPNLNRDVDSQE